MAQNDIAFDFPHLSDDALVARCSPPDTLMQAELDGIARAPLARQRIHPETLKKPPSNPARSSNDPPNKS